MRDQRRFPRRFQEESLSLTVLSAEHLTAQGEKIYCASVDISPVGLQVSMERFIEKESRVEIWMVLLGNRQTFHLQGKVTWVEAREEHGRETWYAGVQLLPVPDSDFDRWLALFDDE